MTEGTKQSIGMKLCNTNSKYNFNNNLIIKDLKSMRNKYLRFKQYSKLNKLNKDIKFFQSKYSFEQKTMFYNKIRKDKTKKQLYRYL